MLDSPSSSLPLVPTGPILTREVVTMDASLLGLGATRGQNCEQHASSSPLFHPHKLLAVSLALRLCLLMVRQYKCGISTDCNPLGCTLIHRLLFLEQCVWTNEYEPMGQICSPEAILYMENGTPPTGDLVFLRKVIRCSPSTVPIQMFHQNISDTHFTEDALVVTWMNLSTKI